MSAPAGRIRHENELEKYAPPGHHGTVNVRLIERDFCGTFEMALGILEPGGTAERHDHDIEHQVIYVLEGLCDVELGDQPAVECGPGTIIEIPPKVMHFVVSKGETPLKVLVLYSPPLPPRNDTPVD
ncbi:MAG: cupin domain-containing protein [Pseudomonadota bacterium]|nr:cupin domain-containing protein [Pseudomonadota bacterium]